MKIQEMALLGLMVLSSGCIATVRSSSRAYLPAQQSKAVLAGTPDDAARLFTELFSRRGFQVTERLERDGGATLYVFKGQRSSVTTVSGGEFGVSSTTGLVGSAFYVLLTPQADTTKAEVFGKPTVDGKVACSNDAPVWVPVCAQDVMTGSMWDGLRQVTGREEAETIRGLLLEMGLSASGGPGSKLVTAEEPPVDPTKPLCVASELPEWKTASAPEKKKLLDRCRAPNVTGGAQAADSK